MVGDSGCNEKKNFNQECTMLKGYVFTVLGLICFVEGLPYLASPGSVRKWLEWLLTASTRNLRFLGGALMIVGLLLVYWGRNHGG